MELNYKCVNCGKIFVDSTAITEKTLLCSKQCEEEYRDYLMGSVKT